jgi:hypothetical protein
MRKLTEPGMEGQAMNVSFKSINEKKSIEMPSHEKWKEI